MVGLGRGRTGLFAWPTIAWIDEAQFGEAEIGHRPRYHADIFSELRFDQNDRRAFRHKFKLAVRTCHRSFSSFQTAVSKIDTLKRVSLAQIGAEIKAGRLRALVIRP